MIVEAFLAILVAIGLVNAWVTWRVIGDDLSSLSQRVAQIGLVWVIPAVGAVIVLNLQRRHGEKGSGRYREMPDVGEDFGHQRQFIKKSDDAADSDLACGCGATFNRWVRQIAVW
jgi:hypothetical protein